MGRGRVPSAAELDPLYGDEGWRSEPEKPRDKSADTPAQHTVFIVVESTDQWDRTWWIVKNYDTKARAIHLAEVIGTTIHKELGIKPERLED